MVGVEQPLDTFLTNALAPSDQRCGINRRLVLKEHLAGEVLVIRVLDPSRDYGFVRKPEGMLEVEQPRHQPRRRRWPARAGREEPRPLPLKELPVDEARELHQLMAQVDEADEPRTEKIILLGRAWAVLHAADRNCRVSG